MAVVRRSDVEAAIRAAEGIPRGGGILQLALDKYKQSLDILSTGLTGALTDAIMAGKKPTELTNIDVEFTESDIQKLLVNVAFLETMFPEMFAVLGPFVNELDEQLKAELVARPVVPESEKSLEYPKPQNDFEQFLISQLVPKEIFYKRDNETDREFYERKYYEMQKYFFSIVVNDAMAVADYFGRSLWFPNILTNPLQVKGVEQGKTADALIKTMRILSNPSGEEVAVATVAAKKLRDKFLVIGSFADTWEKMNYKGFANVTNYAQYLELLNTQLPQPAYLNPGPFLRQLDFPLQSRLESGDWVPENNDAEPVKEKIFRAMQEIIRRRLFPSMRGQDDESVRKMYQNMVLTTKPVMPGHHGAAPTTSGSGKKQPVLRKNLFGAWDYNEHGQREVPKTLSLKSLPTGADGAYLPRFTATKDPDGQREGVQLNVLRKLVPNNMAADLPWTDGENVFDFLERTKDAQFKKHKSAAFALLWAEMFLEIFLESAAQDARVSPGGGMNDYGNPQRMLFTTDLFQPSLVAVNYESGGEKGAKFNSFVIRWQAFFLNYFDYLLLRSEDGKVFTLAQHIMKAKSFEEVPWDKITEGMINTWKDQIRNMGDIANACMGGFKHGNLKKLARVNVETNQVSEINGELAEEIVGINRKVVKYMLDVYCDPSGQFGYEPDKKKQEEMALSTGQFIRVTFECQNPQNPNEIWKKTWVTRAHQYLMFDTADILNWIPRDQKTKLANNQHYSKFFKEKLPGTQIEYDHLVVRMDAKKGAHDVKEAMPDIKRVFTQEIMMRIFSASAGSGDILKSLSMEDVLILGIMFSQEIRDQYQEKYHVSVLTNLWTRAELSLINNPRIQNLLRGMVDREQVELELPQSLGPDLYTREQFLMMLEKMGYKVTFEELMKAGHTLVGALGGGAPQKKH